MKAGLDLENGRVYIETKSGGVQTQTGMSAKVARVLADQLIASADALDNANESGMLDDDTN